MAFLQWFDVLVFEWSGVNFFVMLLMRKTFRDVRLLLRLVRFLDSGRFLVRKLFVVRLFVMLRSARPGLAGKQFDGSTVGRRQRSGGVLRRIVRMAVIVVLQVFKDITDVEECIAIEADVHESRLHAGEDAGDFSFVDAADEGEFFFALDVNFD